MMYSQKDPKYKDTQLGKCANETIGKSGCFLVSFVNLLGTLDIITTPEAFNQIAYKSGCLADATKWASLYNLDYRKDTNNPGITCIAETNFYKNKGVPQHFFLIRKDEKIIDPLATNPGWKANPYPIVSYRVFTKPFETTQRIIDLSHWNTITDWDKLKADFIIHKCTEGTTYLDPTYNERKDRIQGSYHFAGGGDPVKEAEWYVKNSNEDFLCLDWEIEHPSPVAWCSTFKKVVEQTTGKDCWLYTNDARALKYDWPSNWKLWVARYKDYTGILDWAYQPKSNWSIWQYTSRGKLDGITGNVDLNVSKVDLKATQPKPESTQNSDNLPTQNLPPEENTPIEPQTEPEKPVETNFEPPAKPQIPYDAKDTNEPSLFEILINWLISKFK